MGDTVRKCHPICVKALLLEIEPSELRLHNTW